MMSLAIAMPSTSSSARSAPKMRSALSALLAGAAITGMLSGLDPHSSFLDEGRIAGGAGRDQARGFDLLDRQRADLRSNPGRGRTEAARPRQERGRADPATRQWRPDRCENQARAVY